MYKILFTHHVIILPWTYFLVNRLNNHTLTKWLGQYIIYIMYTNIILLPTSFMNNEALSECRPCEVKASQKQKYYYQIKIRI